MKSPAVKICCIASIEEAKLALRYGASALGLVSEMPSGPGPISEELIAEIVQNIPKGISSFLLTSKQDAESIISQQHKTKVNTLQLVDAVPFDAYRKIRNELREISIVQVIHVVGESSIREAVEVSPFVDFILLDSGNPNLKIKELGGTGRKHDWRISKKIVDSVDAPVFLAGGLHAENVREAIEFVRPYGVDICSGVRTNGVLDEEKLEKLFKAVTNIGL
jgi:phosphoribosylanthranilate isomerase